MAVIRVPKTPKKAFDPERPAGTLLQSQLQHLEWAVRPAGARRKGVFKVRPARTEAEAANRIAKLNATLNSQATAPRDVMPNPASIPEPLERPAAASRKRRAKPQPRARQKAKTAPRTRRKTKRRTSR